MTTHGTAGDWLVWGLMLVVGIICSAGSYYMTRLVWVADGKKVGMIYFTFMILFLVFTFLVFIHAPFHVG